MHFAVGSCAKSVSIHASNISIVAQHELLALPKLSTLMPILAALNFIRIS